MRQRTGLLRTECWVPESRLSFEPAFGEVGAGKMESDSLSPCNQDPFVRSQSGKSEFAPRVV